MFNQSCVSTSRNEDVKLTCGFGGKTFNVGKLLSDFGVVAVQLFVEFVCYLKKGQTV